jgi:shikimate kinase
VVALGGGTLTVAANRRRLRDRGALVFLDAPLSVLHRRCRHVGRTRPLFASVQQFKKLYRARLPQYRKAQLRVSTWRNQPQAVAARIAATLGLVPIRRSGENPA